MRAASLVGAWAGLLTTAAVAATGDPWVVTGDVVNVRAGPDTRRPVVFQVYRDDAAVEISRQGEWVEVELLEVGQSGWIHGSLLAPAAPDQAAEIILPSEPPAPTAEAPEPEETVAVEPAPADALPAPAEPTEETTGEAIEEPAGQATETAMTTPAGDAVTQFGSNISELNERAVSAAGIDLFLGVEPVDASTIRVLVTEAWATVPEGGQQSYMNALLDRWTAASGGGSRLTVQVVNPEGKVVREKTGPP